MKTIKTLNDKALIEGVTEKEYCTAPFNPVGTYEPNRKNLEQFLLNLDAVQACARFKSVDTPKSIPEFRIEQMLYNRGALVFFKDEGGIFRLLPFVCNGEMNMYGLLNRVTPIAYNGQIIEGKDAKESARKSSFWTSMPVANFGTEIIDKEAKAVILYDRQNAIMNSDGIEPIAIHQREMIRQIVNRLCVLNSNLINSQGKNIILIKDPKQSNAVNKELKRLYNTDSAYVVWKSRLNIEVINNTIEYQEQSIWEDIMSWNNLRLLNLGITSSGLFNKKERLTNNQSDTNSTQTDRVLDSYFQSRQNFIKTINDVFKDDPDFKEQCGNWHFELNETEQSTMIFGEEEGGKENESDNAIQRSL